MAGVRQWKEAELRVLKAQTGTFAEEVEQPFAPDAHDAAAANSSTNVRRCTFHTYLAFVGFCYENSTHSSPSPERRRHPPRGGHERTWLGVYGVRPQKSAVSCRKTALLNVWLTDAQGGWPATLEAIRARPVCMPLEQVLDAAAGWEAPPLRVLPFAWIWGVAAAQDPMTCNTIVYLTTYTHGVLALHFSGIARPSQAPQVVVVAEGEHTAVAPSASTASTCGQQVIVSSPRAKNAQSHTSAFHAARRSRLSSPLSSSAPHVRDSGGGVSAQQATARVRRRTGGRTRPWCRCGRRCRCS